MRIPKTATVIIVTLNRPEALRRCLCALAAQETMPDEVIVVDSSHNERTRRVAEDFPSALYLAVPHLFGRMTASRNVGLMHAHGDIIAFLDDDAYAHPAWLKNLLASYNSEEIVAVGGRALNQQPGEHCQGRDEIGRLKPNGFLTGHFAADPGRMIKVDHIIGCNMSFRRDVLARLGGFREDFPGISGLCEDTDICLRLRSLGYTLWFQPQASVDHVGAPQAMGQRFNAKYQFYHRRNNFVLLIRNFGFAGMVWRFPCAIAMQAAREFIRTLGSGFGRLIASITGLLFGMLKGFAIFLRNGTDPIRHDAAGEAVRSALQAHTGSLQTLPAGEEKTLR